MNNSKKLKNSLYEIDNMYFPYPWTKNEWDQITLIEYPNSINQLGHMVFTTKDSSNDIIAYALFLAGVDETVSLLKLIVIPNKQRQGIGFNLMTLAINTFKNSNIYLEVNASNNAAINLYKKLGFTQINYIKKFYSNGNDARIFFRIPNIN